VVFSPIAQGVLTGVKLDPGLMSRIDEVLDQVIERDPARTASPPSRP